MAYNKKNWMKEKEEEKKQWAKDAVENIKLYKRKPEDVKEYLNFMSRMYNYSPRNTSSIHAQFPGAGFVASKDKYKELGFEILPNQKGIDIMVPTPLKYFKDEKGKQKQVKYATNSERELINEGKLNTTQKTFYSLKPVYDVTQTNAKPEDYPKIYPNGRVNFDVSDKEVVGEILQATKSYLKENNIPVSTENYSRIGMGAAKGYFSPSENRISLNELNTDTENMTVLIHEAAHAVMHKDNAHLLDSPVKEFEAELTSYIVNKHFGIDTSNFSNEYISQWTMNLTNVKDVETSLKNISRASSQIIEGIANNMEINKEKDIEHTKQPEMSDSVIEKNHDAETEKIKGEKEKMNELSLSFADLPSEKLNEFVKNNDPFLDSLFKEYGDYELKIGNDSPLPGQSHTSFKEKSRLVIDVSEYEKPGTDQLEYLIDQMQMKVYEETFEYPHVVAYHQELKEGVHTITDRYGKVGEFDFNNMNDKEKEFAKKSIELFQKSQSLFLIDNVTDGQVCDMQQFMLLNKDHESMIDHLTGKGNSRETQDMSEQLKKMEQKVGKDADGRLKQPVIHLPSEDLMTPLKAFSAHINSTPDKRQSFEYEIYTDTDRPLFKGNFDKENGKSFIDNLKQDAEKSGKSEELSEGFKQIRTLTQEKDQGMERTR